MSAEVTAWLAKLGLERYAPAFVEAEVDVSVLPELTEADLRELGLPLGPRRKILRAIADLGGGDAVGLAAPAARKLEEPAAESAERRQVTVIFCDLVGSTALSTRVDAEDLRDIIRAYQDCCARVIGRYDGFVARYMGDGVLVYFGFPLANEYDAERAVKASLELIAEVGALEVAGEPLRTRVGIATGEVVVGDLIGEGASMERAVVGETPNLAARLQGLAEPDRVVIADSTRRLLGDMFDLTDNGRRPLKGFSDPVQTWVVVGERAVESRFEAARGSRLHGTLVGRARELEIMSGHWERACAGHGQPLLLVGEAGIGKSRIVDAFLHDVTAGDHELVRFYCSPYHQRSGLHPVTAGLERAADFARSDSAEQRLDKLETLLDSIGVEVSGTAPLLAALLSLPGESRYGTLDMPPARRKIATLEAIEQILLRMAARGRLVFLLEDLHWADPTTLELVDRIAGNISGTRVLMVMTARPEFTPSPAIEPGMLSLSRLPPGEVSAIVQAQTGGKALPGAVMAQIVEHTDGVPLFVEELTKTVLEAGFLRDAGDHFALDGPMPPLAVPTTLQESLTARLDRLAPAKELAQIGALIGRRFSHELIAVVSGIDDDELHQALERLVDAGLIFQRGTPPDAIYTFKHGLVQDAAQASLLRNRRQTLHARIAQALENHFPEMTHTEPELLGHHFTGAGLVSRAVDYWHRAGMHAIERSAHVEAADHLRRGIDMLVTQPHDAARDARELDLQAALGPTLLIGEGYAYPRVADTFQRVHELGRAVADIEREFLALRGLWAFHFVRAEYGRARELAQQLMALAATEDSAALHLEAHRASGMTDLYTGRLATALEHLDAGLARYDRAAHGDHAQRYGNDPGVVCLVYGALALWFTGHAEQALVRSLEGVALADDINHPFTRVQARALACQLYQLRSEPVALRACADEALAIAGAQGGFPFWDSVVEVLRGWAIARDGDPATGVLEIRRGLQKYTATGAEIVRSWFLGLLAEVLQAAGEVDEAPVALEQARSLAASTGEGFYTADLERLAADLTANDDAERRAALNRGLEVARQQGAVAVELRVATDLAAVHLADGGEPGVRDLLLSLIERCTGHREGDDQVAARAMAARLA